MFVGSIRIVYVRAEDVCLNLSVGEMFEGFVRRADVCRICP